MRNTVRSIVLCLLSVLFLVSCVAAAEAQARVENGKIAFSQYWKTGDEKFIQIFSINPGGNDLFDLSHIPGGLITEDNEPTWSPNGNKIAYGSQEDGDWEIYTIDVASLEKANITNNGVNDGYPTWSPDGGRIVYISSEGDLEIYTIDVVSFEKTNLTHNGVDDVYPTWSPDGGKIAYVSNEGRYQLLYTVNSNGIGNTKLTDPVGDNSEVSDISWQPIFVEDPPWTGSPVGEPGSDGTTGGSANTGSTKSTSFKLTKPKLSRSKTNRMTRKRLFSYIRKGFRADISGYKKPSASLVRVIRKRSKTKTKSRRKKTLMRCYKLTKKKVSCKKTSTKGVILKGTSLLYKPLKGKRSLKRLKKGRKIRKGSYYLTFKLKPKAGGKTRTYRYKIKVAR